MHRVCDRPSEAAEALPWVDSLSAQGSTDINRALLEAANMVDRERPTYLIFLTDGLPTEGVVDSQHDPRQLERGSPGEFATVFVWGWLRCGHIFARLPGPGPPRTPAPTSCPMSAWTRSLSAFYAKISTPVLTNLQLDFGELRVYDLYPSPYRICSAARRSSLVGRYREGGPADVTLTGEVNGAGADLPFPGPNLQQRSRADSATLPALDPPVGDAQDRLSIQPGPPAGSQTRRRSTRSCA